LVEVGVQLRITITIDLRVTVVPVVVVPVGETRMGVMVVIEVRVRQVRATMVPDQGIHGTPQVVVVPVGWVMVDPVKVVIIVEVMVVKV
tara:strand:+ start:234 stop:500 length:267 start_codon:yes stop_codon:yes gene_type:complete